MEANFQTNLKALNPCQISFKQFDHLLTFFPEIEKDRYSKRSIKTISNFEASNITEKDGKLGFDNFFYELLLILTKRDSVDSLVIKLPNETPKNTQKSSIFRFLRLFSLLFSKFYIKGFSWRLFKPDPC